MNKIPAFKPGAVALYRKTFASKARALRNSFYLLEKYVELVDLQRQDHAISSFLLRQLYPTVVRKENARSTINQYELRVNSQNGEDGIILHLLSVLGVRFNTFVEIGTGDGRECNTANLSINFGWSGLLVDGSTENISNGRLYYQSRLGASSHNVSLVSSFITTENVDGILCKAGHTGPIDILSIDIDGNDYHVWRALGSLEPRIVIIEYNATFGPEMSITVPYDPTFQRHQKHASGWYHGASLAALARLGAEKGYLLVGCDSNGANAFFVHRDAAAGKINAVSVEDAYYPQAARTAFGSPEEQFSVIQELAYQDV